MYNIKCIILIILLSLASFNCQRRTYCERKANKVARILKDCPNIIDTTSSTDTVYVRDTLRLTITTPIDSSGIDSLLLLYCDALGAKNEIKEGSKDSNVIYRERLVRQYIFKECEKINDGKYLLKDNSGDSVTVQIKGREISVFQNKKTIIKTQKIVIPCPDRDKIGFKDLIFDWWIMLLIIFVLGLASGLYFKGGK